MSIYPGDYLKEVSSTGGFTVIWPEFTCRVSRVNKACLRSFNAWTKYANYMNKAVQSCHGDLLVTVTCCHDYCRDVTALSLPTLVMGKS